MKFIPKIGDILIFHDGCIKLIVRVVEYRKDLPEPSSQHDIIFGSIVLSSTSSIWKAQQYQSFTYDIRNGSGWSLYNTENIWLNLEKKLAAL